MSSHEFSKVDSAISTCNNIDIDCRLRHDVEVLHKKLGQEMKIDGFLNSKHHHDNYKDIRNDVEKINNYIKEAEDQSIELDQDTIKKVNMFTSRLISERNLRKQRDLYLDSINSCSNHQVKKLEGMIEDATKKNVEPEYISNASKLTGQMSGNIKARDTLVMLQDYPDRVYPEPEDDAAKKGNKKDKAPKKKKKKEPPFPTPEWAVEIEAVTDKVKEMEQLAADKENLKLDPEFITNVNAQMQRFKKEIVYRKQKLEEERIEAELKAAKKKSKKKA